MNPELQIGRSAEVNFTVTPEMCPHFDGILVHPVLATWTVVHQMEVAGRKLLAPHLEPGNEGIGAHIRVDHRSPAPIGSHVRVVATATGVTANRLTCRVAAYCGPRLLAEGEFVQVVMSKARLAGLIERHLNRAATDQD